MEFSLAPKILGYIAGFPITNTFWVTIFVSLILVAAFVSMARRMQLVPSGFQMVIETLVAGAHDFLESLSGSATMTRRLFPFVLTTFLLFLAGNMLSYLPGLPSVTFHGEALYRTATTDYNLIFILALAFIIAAQVAGIATGGVLGYIKKFINFNSPLKFVLGIMDIVGECAKLISVSFRFFGNAFAGEVLVAVLLFIFPYVLPIPFTALLLISSLVQPAVFAILVVIYIQLGVIEREEKKVE